MQIIQAALRRAILFLTLLFCAAVYNKAYSASLSQLLISEVMANPSAVGDTSGEWFELYNPTTLAVDLNGIILMDNGSNRHVIDNGGALLINPGDYLVLARNGDTTVNGGLVADYAYGSGFSMTNTSDAIILTDAVSQVLRLEYSSGFAVTGVSRELTFAGGTEADYSLALISYGAGDLGTPGFGSYDLSLPAAVPLPAAAWLLGSGLLALVGVARRAAPEEVSPAVA